MRIQLQRKKTQENASYKIEAERNTGRPKKGIITIYATGTSQGKAGGVGSVRFFWTFFWPIGKGRI